MQPLMPEPRSHAVLEADLQELSRVLCSLEDALERVGFPRASRKASGVRWAAYANNLHRGALEWLGAMLQQADQAETEYGGDRVTGIRALAEEARNAVAAGCALERARLSAWRPSWTRRSRLYPLVQCRPWTPRRS